MKKITESLLFATVITLIVFPRTAHAYLDPNTGSYLLQMAAAALFGGLFVLKTGWTQIKRFITSTLLRKDPSKSEKSNLDKSK